MIPVYEPWRAKNQIPYVIQAMESNWISSRGPYVDRFEKELAEQLGVKHAITTSNGTVSLTLILAALGIKAGDEVITPSLTYAATVSSIIWAGATPVLIDCDDHLQLDQSQLDDCLTSKTKAIMLPELYGDCVADLSGLLAWCKRNQVLLIEDSAEAFMCHHSEPDGYLGTFGVAGSFSFFANKSITGGELGAVITNSDSLAAEMRLLRSQAHIGNFVHRGPGFNFRSTNLSCAIACAQLEDYTQIHDAKTSIADSYRAYLADEIIRIYPRVNSAEWMPIFLLPIEYAYQDFYEHMQSCGVDIRPCFRPIHLCPGWSGLRQPVSLARSEAMCTQGFQLPAYPGLTSEQIRHIIKSVDRFFTKD